MRRQATLAVLLALSLSGCWLQFRGGAAHTGTQTLPSGITVATASTLVPSWSAASGPASTSPSLINDTVYIGADDGKLSAFDATGVTSCSGAPTTCAPLWTATTGGAVRSSPALTTTQMYIGSDDGKLYAFDVNGVTGCAGTPKTCSPLWTATTGGAIESSPAIAGNVVYVGSDDGKLYAFDSRGITGCAGTPKTCTPLWTATTGGIVRSSPAIANNTTIVGSDDGKLYAYDANGVTGCAGTPKTCTPLWTATTGGAVRSSPAIVGDAVHVASLGGGLRSYSLHPAAATSTTLGSSANPASSGASVTFTATISSAAGTPTGSVTFADNGTTIGTGTLTNGSATFTTSTLSVGNHPISAHYTGNAAFAPSTSGTLTQIIGAALFVDRNNANCSDAGSGTINAPFCTITAAAQHVTPGETVTVAGGTYPETVTMVTSGTSASPITFTAAPGATVTLTGGTFGFSMTTKSWITVRGFTVTNTSSYGFRVTGSDHITLDANRAANAGQPVSGLTAYGIGVNSTTQSSFTGNVTDHNSDAGIHLAGSSNNNVIADNESFANARGYVRAAAGIDVRDSTGNLVTGNRTHDNEDSGINAWTGTTNGSNTFSDNVSYLNGDHGIDVHNAVDARVVSNTVFSNVDSGIESTTSTNTYIANNVSVDNGINSPRTSGQIRIDGPSTATAILDDDLVWMHVSGVMIDWNGTQYSSLAAFRAATGQESRGIEADPKFRASASADFHLLAGSPAIDSANSGALGEPSTDHDGLGRFDDPATTNTGIGPITYADRGAFEYQG